MIGWVSQAICLANIAQSREVMPAGAPCQAVASGFQLQVPSSVTRLGLTNPLDFFSELTQAVDSESVTVYYTHPYTSCERGTNERHNGLIRRFIPKGKAIETVDDTLIGYVENWCNTLPRKILGYQAPNDRFAEEIDQIA